MPARLTPEGLLVISWDFHVNRWKSQLRLPGVQDLYRVTDLLPGITMSDLFDLVEQDPELMSFFGKLCWCDLYAVQRRSRVPVEEIVVYPSCRARRGGESGAPAEFLLLKKWASIHETSDEHEYEAPLSRQFDMHYQLWAGRDDSSQYELIADPRIGHASGSFELHLDACFGAAVALPLRLSPTMQMGCMPESQDPDEQVETTFTLLEILSSILFPLGNSPQLMNADQPRIEIEEIIRRLFPEANDSDDEPWSL